ncbi:PREDICTED: neural Wiskott-Aldrich syndrome protein-like [Priapulus caudatus]|uniref:Neural Wiskott-Aldrich syndrome protein-like n=1 Tax=Priapulus caudatus TaxID=37621 RepID=A0ABM1DQT4_PRICU|nr:PREDICTED: neural Wiskott-Aldrich syndrome protein-like [Priapulus caudatus]
MSVKRTTPVNTGSSLLRNDENERLFGLLGKGCTTLVSAVVQVYLAEPNPQRWKRKTCGMVCFVKDGNKRSYFLRAYDLRQGALVWEQEVYTQFKYRSPRPYFHTFAGDMCEAGLNFASEQEAATLCSVLQSKINERQARKQEKRRQGMTQNPSESAAPTVTGTSQMVRIDERTIIEKKKKEQRGKRQKLTKADIGLPSDFQHVAHVGWDPNKGFDMNNLDPNLKTLFEKVGISENDLQDTATRSFIYDFIAKQGGLEAVKREASVYLAEPNPQRWKRKTCGMVCLSRTATSARTSCAAYDLRQGALVWEQEVYTQFKYASPRPYFHTFAGDMCEVGLNFASEQEAATLWQCPAEQDQRASSSQAEKRRQGMTQNASESAAPTVTGTSQCTSRTLGWDPNKGFDMNNARSELKTLFEKVGISRERPPGHGDAQLHLRLHREAGRPGAVKREASVHAPSARRPRRTAPPPRHPRNQIHNFKGAGALRHVDASTHAGGDERGDLLSAIRQGRKLNPVDHSDVPPPPPADDETEGIAGALLNALKQREMAIQGYDSSGSDDDDDDDDWSD